MEKKLLRKIYKDVHFITVVVKVYLVLILGFLFIAFVVGMLA